MKFEYKELNAYNWDDVFDIEDLNKLGSEGWEVVYLHRDNENGHIRYVLLKRQVEDNVMRGIMCRCNDIKE